MESCKIRHAKADDVGTLFGIFRKAVLQINSMDYTPEQIDAWIGRATLGRWQEIFGSGLQFFVAECCGRAVGFVSVNAAGYLHALYVHPDFLRQGIATALLRRAEACAAAQGARRLFSEVSITARPCFEKAGFAVLEEQIVQLNGVSLINYRMERYLENGMLAFRPAVPADAERIMEIICQAQAQMRALGSNQWQHGYPALGNIALDVKRGWGYVLCAGMRIVAYGAVIFDGERAYAAISGAWLSDVPYAVVHRLAVADEVKQQGIATEFMCRVEALCREREVCSFRVDTNFDNRYMLSMLERLGFTRCGEIEYEGDPRIAFEKLIF